MKKKNIIKLKRKISHLFSQLRDNKKLEYNRVLPFNEYLNDRWEKANYLKWGERSNCYDSVYVFGDVEVGENTFIGPFCILDGGGGLRIGKFCSISAGVQIYTHNSVQWSNQGGKEPLEFSPVIIEDYCYVGPNSVISMGVRIGKGAVVGACSFVNKDVPPYTKVAGCPARIIGGIMNQNNNNPAGGGGYLEYPIKLTLLSHRRVA
ncbi:acyltransferase [Helicobacter sp. MIT 11-5569]|uniref:acyltransferase n=1 Tax=Helicobacter sp. MIT 11-5569 TaxID=1548151 RepID=UPI0010FE70A2|nr:acyltransferase [Helicobacter sp. MIT 11-5569]TLD84589.1 acyltransferase [Helicobacter sp. MIT 11-5569]